jgi:hypothetical protein
MSHSIGDNSTTRKQENEMYWLRQILFRLSAYCRCRVINGPDQKPYLERYHLLCLPFNYRLYLHRFVASDPGRGLHNHPWKHALSFLLCGEYEETRMRSAIADNELETRRLGAGRLNFINGSVFHRVNIRENSECWSLFLHGPKAKGWGFIQQRGYTDHHLVVEQSSNPLWWKNACRPIQAPDIRHPCSP